VPLIICAWLAAAAAVRLAAAAVLADFLLDRHSQLELHSA
jgi:hypothetical protein